MDECQWLHHQIEPLPISKYPFKTEELPHNGIYFFYEDGEWCEHNNKCLRIVRIGTHKSNNFRSRINDHFLLGEKKMNFNSMKPAPKDRSIFRKNIGRALLNRDKDNYLEMWEIDFTTRNRREQDGQRRDIQKEKIIEEGITQILRKSFSFRFLIVDCQDKRMGKKGLESSLIGTVARCKRCKASNNWLGNHSPKPEIKQSGLWLSQHLNALPIDENEKKDILNAITKTRNWIEKNNRDVS